MRCGRPPDPCEWTGEGGLLRGDEGQNEAGEMGTDGKAMPRSPTASWRQRGAIGGCCVRDARRGSSSEVCPQVGGLRGWRSARRGPCSGWKGEASLPWVAAESWGSVVPQRPSSTVWPCACCLVTGKALCTGRPRSSIPGGDAARESCTIASARGRLPHCPERGLLPWAPATPASGSELAAGLARTPCHAPGVALSLAALGEACHSADACPGRAVSPLWALGSGCGCGLGQGRQKGWSGGLLCPS